MSDKAPIIDAYMAKDLITLKPDDSIHHAVKVLMAHRISGAPVLDDQGRLVGVLSKKDCLKVVYSSSYHQEWGGRVADYMSDELVTLEAGTDVIAAADVFANSEFRRFPVMKDGQLVGQISRHDILRALEEMWPGDRD